MLLALILAAAAPEWSLTESSWSQTDPGNGHIIASSDVTTTVTPAEVKQRSEGENHGKPFKIESKPRPLPPELRDAIALALTKLPDKSATYSISPYVDDEGGRGASVTIDRAGKHLVFQLMQGPRYPPVPAELTELQKLVAKASALLAKR